MAITATMVKELRDVSGAGMMDAKRALTETEGNMEAAIDWLRTKGLAKAAKKSGRTAAEGLVGVAVTGGVGVAAGCGVGAATGAGPGAGTGARAGTDMGSGAGAFEAGAAEAGVTARAGVAVGAGRSRSGATWSVGRDCAKAAPDRPSRSSGIRRMRVFGSMRIEPLPSFAMRVRPPEPPC